MFKPIGYKAYHTKPKTSWSKRAWYTWVWAPVWACAYEMQEGYFTGVASARFVTEKGTEFFERCEYFREVYGMKKKASKEAWETTWVHVDLTPDQKGEYKAWDLEEVDMWVLWGSYLAQGYKTNEVYIASSSSYQASLICRDDDSVNSGMGVSAYARELRDAVRVVLYKAEVILPPKWGDYKSPGGDDIG